MFLQVQAMLLVTAVVMALSATGGWKLTQNYYQNQIAQIKLEQAKDTLERERLIAEVKEKNHALSEAGLELSAVISERDAARLRQIDIVEREVYVEIVKYRDRPPVLPVDGTCYIDSEWVRLHNHAAGGGVPEATAAASSADEGATYADTLGTVAANYATCNKIRATVIGWQEFYEGVRRLHTP